jgi:hypothetical protein
MISKKKRLKLEFIIERIWTLNLDELERLSNEIEAEIQLRDIDNRIIIDSTEKNKNEVIKRGVDGNNNNVGSNNHSRDC